MIRKSIGVVDQVRVALAPQYRLATGLGAAIGAAVPVMSYAILHIELADWKQNLLKGNVTAEPLAFVVAGGLAYSAPKVATWGRLALGNWWLAIAFTVLMEGVMTLSGLWWLSGLALVYLCAINATATGVTMARGETPPVRTLPKAKARHTQLGRGRQPR